MDYKLTVGLEVHAELKTKTKMFCNSANDPFNSEPNANICPVCMAHPGSLPVINKQAVHHVLRVGTALGSKLADFTEFDRKNYFYPDIPKGYQISQYKYPLVSGGLLNGIAIERVHLEEDTASSSHEGSGSLIDYNRAGVPLMELVTTPTIHSAEEASAFARELQLLLRTLGVSDANMEKGEMRVEANISISKTDTLGTKVEVKNLNSFRSVERAIAFEVERMTRILDGGPGEIVQETRGWDEGKQATYSQRKKESAHDYRYFPDPDLPKLKISEIPEFSNEKLKASMPELPWEKRTRLLRDYGLKPENVDIFTSDPVLGGLFEDTMRVLGGEASKLSGLAENYITSDITGLRKAGPSLGGVTGRNLADLVTMIKAGDLSSRGAKDTLAIIYADGGEPKAIAEKNGFIQKNDIEALKKIVDEIISTNPTVVADYKGGKTALFQFFIGQGMKASKGSANPEVLKKLFEEVLK